MHFIQNRIEVWPIISDLCVGNKEEMGEGRIMALYSTALGHPNIDY